MEIYITDEIDSELVECVKNQIDAAKLNKTQKIVFKINSTGGSVVAGLSLYDLISTINNIETEAYIYGLCASAATYPALACDKVIITQNSTFMIHPCTGGLYGTIEEIEADLDYFKSLEDRVLTIYENKTGKSKDDIKTIWKPAKYFTALEAKEYGFVDEIAGMVQLTLPLEVQEEEVEEEIIEDKMTILSLKNVVKKCKELIKKPIEEADEVQELTDKLKESELKNKSLEAENESIKSALEANIAEMKIQLENLKNESENLYNAIEISKKDIERTIEIEVNNRIASMGYEPEELPEKVNKIETTNISEIVKNKGLDEAIRTIIGNKLV